MASPPAHKRQKSSASATSPTRMSAQTPSNPRALPSEDPTFQLAPSPSLTNPRKRRVSQNATSTPAATTSAPAIATPSTAGALATTTAGTAATITSPLTPENAAKKKGRTNTPWTPEEEQKLQQMRGENKGWSEIAKDGRKRQKALVQSLLHLTDAEMHTKRRTRADCRQDMHYAEFNEDEASALREAIRDYEANKWKTIGQKVGKPAKACEHYARENFRSS